jgi:hypothetical protein
VGFEPTVRITVRRLSSPLSARVEPNFPSAKQKTGVYGKRTTPPVQAKKPQRFNPPRRRRRMQCKHLHLEPGLSSTHPFGDSFIVKNWRSGRGERWVSSWPSPAPNSWGTLEIWESRWDSYATGPTLFRFPKLPSGVSADQMGPIVPLTCGETG